MTWCVLDLETQNHEYYGSLASPHHPQNYIVAAAFAHDDARRKRRKPRTGGSTRLSGRPLGVRGR